MFHQTLSIYNVKKYSHKLNFFQMSLCERFAQASCIKTVNIRSLEKEKPYCAIGVERMQTKYGISILLTIKMTSTDSVRLFLLRRFTLIFLDDDIDMIKMEW